MSSSASSRPMAGARPRRCSTASRSCRAAQIEYRGHTLTEMDLDALLARRPQLALVDELAHTNAPGSRHPKRYMDVEELIAAGIDVYTTLNVQHVESLNDVVARITRIRVRETVPDSIIDKADDIELIDLTPRGPDPAAARRQGLRAAPGRTRDPPLFLARQPDRAARTRAAPHRAAGRRPDGALHAGARDPRPMGGRRAHPGLHRRRCQQHRRGAPRQAHGRQPEGALDRRARRDRARPRPSATPSATGSPRRCGWRSGSARRRSRCRARTWRTRSSSTRAPTTSRTSSSCSRRAPGGASCSTARWRNS